ncbi:JAB domain-containing protein [Streptomyces flaveolus]|uniref:JAB domain-containing protein n=1 Tax=Streptomyces flaveolus TaxID=67297 RepID=UPI00381E5E21
MEPSEPDRRATARLSAGAGAVGLRFLDHVVVTDREWRRVEATLRLSAGFGPATAARRTQR